MRGSPWSQAHYPPPLHNSGAALVVAFPTLAPQWPCTVGTTWGTLHPRQAFCILTVVTRLSHQCQRQLLVWPLIPSTWLKKGRYLKGIHSPEEPVTLMQTLNPTHFFLNFWPHYRAWDLSSLTRTEPMQWSLTTGPLGTSNPT